MITPSAEYLAALHKIQDNNHPHQVIYIPKDKPIYEIDLNSRAVASPEFLSVEYDHNSTSIFFAVDRFYDNIDLSNMACVIQYENANPDKSKRGYIYGVPFYDITTLSEQNKLLFEWDIEGPATAYEGTVTFSIKFYKISLQKTTDKNGQEKEIRAYDYILNTTPVTSKVLQGLNIYEASNNYMLEANVIDIIYQRLSAVENFNKDLYWIVLDDTTVLEDDYPPNVINKNENIYNNLG